VALLGRVVSPGAATEGVTLIFLLKKIDDLLVITVCQFHGVTLLILSYKTDDLFCYHRHFIDISLGRHPLEDVTRVGPPPPF